MSAPPTRSAWLLAGLLALTGCSKPASLELVIAPREIPRQLATELEGLFGSVERGELTISTEVGAGELGNLEQLAEGAADLAIVPNNVPFRDNVRTVAVLYTGVLHTLHRRPGEPASLVELVTGARVFAGPEGSVERWLLTTLTERAHLEPDTYSLVDDIEDADVVMLFAPIVPTVPPQLVSGWRLFSFGDVDELGRGAAVEGVALSHPQLRPFVIPARSYWELDHGPIVTLGVDVVLVARADLDAEVVHDLTEILVGHRRQLTEQRPELFAGLHAEPVTATLTFPLHEGARQYFDRDQPGVFERYADVAGVGFSVAVASWSGLVAFGRWRSHRRKDRIDLYYVAVLRVRREIGAMTEAEHRAAIAELNALEARAFEALINEELAADDTFRIFMALVSDTLRDLRLALRAEARALNKE